MRPVKIFDGTSRFSPDPKPEKTQKKPPVKLKRTPLNKIRKTTGEKQVFEFVDKTRKHFSFVSGEFLGKDLCAWNFAHVLSKNKFPLFRLQSKNIALLTQEEHREWDCGLRETLRQLPEWNAMFELESELKKEYELLNKKK